MSLMHRSDGKNGCEEGTFIKLNWGVLITVLVTVAIAIFGIVNTVNVSAHTDLNSKVDKLVNSITSLTSIVNLNCSEIMVLKSESTTTKNGLEKIDGKLENIRRDQTEFYSSRGFKTTRTGP